MTARGFLWHWEEKRTGAKILDVIVALFWATQAGLYLGAMVQKQNYTNLGLLIFYSLVAVLFLTRRPAHRSAPLWQTAVALVDVFLPAVLLRPEGRGLWVGNVVQVAALGVIIVAAFSLGPSFGIAPADRGLRTGGLYAWIRHPLYAGESLFYTGYLMTHTSWRNFIGLAVAITLFVVRIRWEERIIEGYEHYARRVRWRLLPYVW